MRRARLEMPMSTADLISDAVCTGHTRVGGTGAVASHAPSASKRPPRRRSPEGEPEWAHLVSSASREEQQLCIHAEAAPVGLHVPAG